MKKGTDKKVAIVTGGTKGIGKQIIKDLLKRDYFVFTNFNSDSKAAEEAEIEFSEINNSFKIIKANQGNKIEFNQFINYIKSTNPTIQCIVGSAGSTLRKSPMEITDNEWELVMQITLNSHFYLIRDLYNYIIPNSRIIFIGSMLGITPHATSLPYGVAKSALHSLAKNLVKEFESTNTTVNTIAPGFVETQWQQNKPQSIRDNIYNKCAIKRFADVNEISSAVLFCLDNAFINGSVIEINGGYNFK